MDDVAKIIMDYYEQLVQTELVIKTVNDRYKNIIGMTFDSFNEVEDFLSILKSEIRGNLLIILENRCIVCDNDYSDGFYTYTDDNKLTLGGLLEFCLYLKKSGIICEHEIVSSVQTSNILCVINLKCPQNVSDN